MTQKLDSSKKSGEELLQTIQPKGIADESMRQTIERDITEPNIEMGLVEIERLKCLNINLRYSLNRENVGNLFTQRQ
jgi:hypothetical protein